MKGKIGTGWLMGILVCLLSQPACSKWNNSASPRISGTIESDETHVASRYGGRIEKVLAQEGDTLAPNQVIVELEASELRARWDQMAALLAEWEAGPRKEEVAAAKNDWESLLAELEFARIDAKRAKDLYEQRTISEVERDRALSRATSLEKSAAAAKARYDLLLAGTRPERLAQSRAQLAELDAQLREMRIVAPTNCVLEVLSVKVGDVLPPNREIATLLLPHLWVRVFVPESWLGHIQLRQKVDVRVDSFPDQTFTGEIEQISRSAQFTPRNVQTVEERVKQVFGVKIRLPHDEDKLRAGMSADVVFPILVQKK